GPAPAPLGVRPAVRVISVWSKSGSVGFVHFKIARPSPPLAWRFWTCPGGLLSVGGGNAGGVVPGAGLGRTVSFALAVALLPLASTAVKMTVVVPTGKNAGELAVTLWLGSAISDTLYPKMNFVIGPWSAASEPPSLVA